MISGPHTRVNPLTGEVVLVSPHRLLRPWQGKVEDLPPDNRPQYDPKCYLCPGNRRAGDFQNPPYDSTFVFDNDFSALLPGTSESAGEAEGLMVSRAERGLCRVICFSPRHDLTIAEMATPDIARVVNVWAEQCLDLGARDFIHYVQVFENKGALMGCSNPHPHGQIWATEHLPYEPSREDFNQREYFARNHRTLLSDYARREATERDRIVCQNEHWTAVVPFWAKWPYEILVVPARPVSRIPELTDVERNDLADILRRVATRYDNLFRVSFPYTMGFHQAPYDGREHPHWHLHAHFYPPLLRSATIQKFMVGFEMLAMPQRDLTAEQAAERLREQSETHYKAEPKQTS